MTVKIRDVWNDQRLIQTGSGGDPAGNKGLL